MIFSFAKNLRNLRFIFWKNNSAAFAAVFAAYAAAPRAGDPPLQVTGDK